MKKSDIKTLDDLKEFLTEYCKENPEDDCCELVRGICEANGWIYTADSVLNYEDEDFATDGENLLSLMSDGWHIFQGNGVDMEYKGRDITVREDAENYYVDFCTGLGEGVYPKADWDLTPAIYDQMNIYKENKAEQPISVEDLLPSEHYDTLVEADDVMLLCKHSDIYEGVSGNDLCDWDILIMGNNGLLMQPNEQLIYSEAYFGDMYEKVKQGDEDEDTVYKDCDFDNEEIAVRKLSEIPSDIKQSYVDVEHGINTDEICVTDAEVIRGKVYEASLHTPQNYPTQEYEDAFLLVDEDGNKRYIKRISPFFADAQRDVYEEITEQEFKEFCD